MNSNKIILCWGNLIKTYLELYNNITESNINNALAIILDIIFQLENNIDNIYKSLIYINKGSKLGQFSLIYQKNIEEAIINNNWDNLKELILQPFTPEYDNNTLLNQDELNEINNQFKIEKLSLNYYTTNYNINLTYSQCIEDICIYMNPEKEIIDSKIYNIWIIQKLENLTISWCFRLIELLNLIYLNKNNPYTNNKFENIIIQMIKSRYATQLKLIQIYNDNLN